MTSVALMIHGDLHPTARSVRRARTGVKFP
jgi:hypothetical protein